MTQTRLFIIILAAISVWVHPIYAQQLEGSQFRAIVVGVTDYEGGLKSTPRLKLDVAARRVRDAIREIARRNGFVSDEDVEIKVLVDNGKREDKPTLTNFVNKLEFFAKISDDNDYLAVYFTGHGEEGRLLLSGAFPELSGGHLSFTRFEKIIRESAAKRKLIILDTCRVINTLGTPENIRASKFVPESPSEGEAWYLSTKYGHPSHIDRSIGYGYYTKIFLATLKQHSKSARLTGRQLGKLLKKAVPEAIIQASLGLPQDPSDRVESSFNLWGPIEENPILPGPTGVVSPQLVELSLQLDRQEKESIQLGLKTFGFQVGKVDGLLGNLTRQAIRLYQKVAGLNVTGYLDADQAKALIAGNLQIPTRTPADKDGDAIGFVRTNGQQMINWLIDKDFSEELRIQLFSASIKKHFNLVLIAKFSLGRHWRRATEQQKKEYLGLFEKFIAQAYVARFKGYEGATFNVGTERNINDRDVLISSSLTLVDSRQIPIHWRVRGSSDYKGKSVV